MAIHHFITRQWIGLILLPLVFTNFWTKIVEHNAACGAEIAKSPEMLGACAGGFVGTVGGMVFWIIVFYFLLRRQRKKQPFTNSKP